MCKLLVPAETYQQWNAAFQRMGDVFDAFELCEMVSHMPVDCVRRLPDFLPTWAARVHPRFATLEIYRTSRPVRSFAGFVLLRIHSIRHSLSFLESLFAFVWMI